MLKGGFSVYEFYIFTGTYPAAQTAVDTFVGYGKRIVCILLDLQVRPNEFFEVCQPHQPQGQFFTFMVEYYFSIFLISQRIVSTPPALSSFSPSFCALSLIIFELIS